MIIYRRRVGGISTDLSSGRSHVFLPVTHYPAGSHLVGKATISPLPNNIKECIVSIGPYASPLFTTKFGAELISASVEWSVFGYFKTTELARIR